MTLPLLNTHFYEQRLHKLRYSMRTYIPNKGNEHISYQTVYWVIWFGASAVMKRELTTTSGNSSNMLLCRSLGTDHVSTFGELNASL